MSKISLSAEQQAEHELAHTEVLSPATSRLLVAVFLLVIATVLPLQMVVEWRRGERLQIVQLWRTPLTGPDLAAFEEAHEDANILAQWVQPRMQLLLSQWGGAGNSSAVLGRDGWLFYEPGVSHLAGPNPLGDQALARRRSQGEPHPDPRPALAALAADCAAAGVQLVLLPISDKAAIHPEFLTNRFNDPLPDPAVAALAQWAEDHPLTVIDPWPWLVAEREHSGQAFLAQDTHWTPAAMQRVAAEVARVMAPMIGDDARYSWQQQTQEVTRVGDLVDLLRLSPGQALYAPETVSVNQVQNPDGEAWQPQRRSPILLLGDSFSNIFHLSDMGWGVSAGFAAHLAAATAREVDQIAINGGGADAVRVELARRSRALDGVKVLVYQFSSRDLSHGSWPVIPLPVSAEGPLDDPQSASSTALVEVRARVLIAAPAASLSAPYEHARGAMLLEVLSATGDGDRPQVGEEILVQTPVMESRRLRPAARWREGDTLELPMTRGVPALWQGRELLDDTFVFDDRPIWWHDPAAEAANP